MSEYLKSQLNPRSQEDSVEDTLDDMNRSELKELILKNGWEIRVNRSMSDDDIREAIRSKTDEEWQEIEAKENNFWRKMFWRESKADRIILWAECGLFLAGLIAIAIVAIIS